MNNVYNQKPVQDFYPQNNGRTVTEFKDQSQPFIPSSK